MAGSLAAAAVILGLGATGEARAGGFGAMVMGGTHTERLWYHSNAITEDNQTILVDDPAEYDKYELVETLPNMGAGVEVLMGDRDDRILGSFRFYYMVDAAQKDPADVSNEVSAKELCDNLGADAPPECDADSVLIRAYREDPRKIGMGMVGLSWGILGSPENFQFGVVGHLGTGFLTNDHTEFLALSAGPGITWKFARQMQVFADLGYMMRYRKGFSHGTHATAGIRYLFD